MTEMLVERTVEINAELLRSAAEILGTETDSATINATLEYLVNGGRRRQALEGLKEAARRGDFDHMLAKSYKDEAWRGNGT